MQMHRIHVYEKSRRYLWKLYLSIFFIYMHKFDILLESLVKQLYPISSNDSEKLDQLLSYCQRILQCTFSIEFKNTSNQHLVNTVKKKLLRDDSSGSLSVAFSNAYEKLLDMKFVDHSWELVYFLYQISLQQTHSHQAIRTNSSILFSPAQPLSQKSSVKSPITQKISIVSSLKNWLIFLNQSGHVSEETIVRDVLLLLGGSLKDSCYIRYDHIHDLYLIDPACTISLASRNMIQELSKLANDSLYIQNQIHNFPPGKIYTALSCWIKSNVLDSYYDSITRLSSNNPSIPKTLCSLYKTLQSHFEIFQQFRHVITLSRFVIVNSNGIAQVLSILYENLFHTYKSLFPILESPYHHMITYWIEQGSLIDPYNEFFIYESNLSSSQDNIDDNPKIFTLWKDKFIMDVSRVPYFIDQDTASKIFVLGKSKWFMNLHLGSTKNNDINMKLWHNRQSILERYQLDAPRLLALLRNDKSIMLDQHIMAMKRYFLGEQSDFIQDLMDTLSIELSKPASLVFRHHLIGIFDDVLHRYQYNTDMAIRRLDVRLLKSSKSDQGWDVFTLDYHVDPPLDNIFTIPVMASYMKIFRLIWKLKRCEYVLNLSWKRLCIIGKSSSMYHALIRQHRPALRLSHSTLNYMQFVITALLHYILLYVIESSWKHLLAAKSQDLDMYNKTHQYYLNSILSNAFFIASDHGKGLLSRMTFIIQTIYKFDRLQFEFCQYFETSLNINEIMKTVQELNQCSESFHMHLKHFSSDLLEISASNTMYNYLYALLTFNKS